ncbi:MAG: hypothetical protein A2X83_05150, partial [Desulfuromonadales bacterium GWD2_54_10]
MARYELKPSTRTCCFIFLSLLLLVIMSASPALCDVEDLLEAESEEETQDFSKEGLKPLTSVSLQTGYRFVTPDGPMAAASPYGRLKSGVTGGFSAASLGSDLKLSVDGLFLHEDDYKSEMVFDYAGLVRFHAASDALWHNLLREQITPGTLTLVERDTGREYGIRTATTQAETRIKLGNNPFHVNVGYWELTRQGYEQHRFSDVYFGPGASSMISDAARVDRVTREGTVGLDAHLGLFDISYGFLIRDFSNEAADSRNIFTNTAGGALAVGSAQAFSTIPNSRVTSHTIKLFTDLSGGLVGSAAYTLTQRENTGGHGDAVPSSRPADTIQNYAGDLSYTPFKELSFALKYRHQQIDRDSPITVNYPYSQIPAVGVIPGVYTATTGILLVRPSTDTVKDTLMFSSIYRPDPKMIYRLEYLAVLESRDNVWDFRSASKPTAIHSDSRQTHTGKAAFFWKPYAGVKLNASYSYAASDNPAYGSSFSDRHIGNLLLTYTNSGKWGLTGSYLAQFESGESIASTVLPAPVATYALPRESRNNSANASFWFSPLERLTVTTSYSYLESDVDQTILFTNNPSAANADPLTATNYHVSSHVYGIDAVYATMEQLDLSLAFQQVLSISRFAVPTRSYPLTFPGTYTTDGITDLTRLDTTETGVSARADWRITALLGCALDYSFRLYDSGNSAYDGSVHTTMLN